MALRKWGEEQAIKRKVVEKYAEDRPTGGTEFDAWIATAAQEFGISKILVRRYVIEYTQGYLDTIQNQTQTYAQRVAEAAGATMLQALETLKKGMLATKKRAVVIGKGEDAKIEYYETPDWASRLTAATRTLDVHGSWAPKQLEIHSRNENFNITDAELVKQLQELTSQIATYIPASGGRATQVAEGTAVKQRIEGATSPEGLLLLDDGVHEDGGRAGGNGSGPVSSIPEGSLHKKPRGRPRKRASSPD